MAHTKLEWMLLMVVAIAVTSLALALIGSAWQSLITCALEAIR